MAGKSKLLSTKDLAWQNVGVEWERKAISASMKLQDLEEWVFT